MQLVLPPTVETLLTRLAETPQKIETEREKAPVSVSVSKPQKQKGPSVLDQIETWLRNNPSWLEEKAPRIQEELGKHGIKATPQYINTAKRMINATAD